MALKSATSVRRDSHWLVGAGAWWEQTVLGHFSHYQVLVSCLHNFWKRKRWRWQYLIMTSKGMSLSTHRSPWGCSVLIRSRICLGSRKNQYELCGDFQWKQWPLSPELVTVRKPIDLADAKCLNTLASSIPSCSSQRLVAQWRLLELLDSPWEFFCFFLLLTGEQ